MANLEALDRVAHQLVTPENPPQDIDGMDSERCAVLHNAILEHAFLATGRSTEDYHHDSQTWFELCGHEEAQIAKLEPSLQAFLRQARVLPDEHRLHFFYNVEGLRYPGELMWLSSWMDEEDPNRLVTLYGAYSWLVSHADGLVYCQTDHTAVMRFSIHDDLPPDESWQKLESILSVWIEMIRRQKVVALPDDVGKSGYENTTQGWQEVKGPERDLLTGAKRLHGETEPWTMVPWSGQDLEETLEVWELAVSTIERKMELPDDVEAHHGLIDEETLRTTRVPSDGFAYRFLREARIPRFKYIAPGLRMPNTEEFRIQPLMAAWEDHRLEEGQIPPILIFRNDATVRTEELRFGYPYSGLTALVPRCPAGLYFADCDRSYGSPFEDGCRLVLPFKLGGHAKQSDYSPVKGYDNLLQHGHNVFNEYHSAQLQAFLENIYGNVFEGRWAVDAQGVTGGIEVWKEAEREDQWENYWMPLGPSRYW